MPSESTTSSVIDPPLHELSTKSSSTAFVSTRTLYSSRCVDSPCVWRRELSARSCSAVPTLGSAVNEPGYIVPPRAWLYELTDFKGNLIQGH